MNRNERYDHLIKMAQQRIETIKTLPFYRIFGTETQRKQDIRKKLELITWLTLRKMDTRYIAADKDGTVSVHSSRPERTNINTWDSESFQDISHEAAKMLTGKELSWEDNPIEIIPQC